MAARIIKREKYTREDGFLAELFSKKYGDFEAVHSYLVSIEPGKAWAGHFHKNKKELLFPVDGRIIVFLSDGTEKKEVMLDSENDEYSALLIPANIAHLVKNNSDDNVQIVVFSESTDLEDTYQYEVGE